MENEVRVYFLYTCDIHRSVKSLSLKLRTADEEQLGRKLVSMLRHQLDDVNLSREEKNKASKWLLGLKFDTASIIDLAYEVRRHGFNYIHLEMDTLNLASGQFDDYADED